MIYTIQLRLTREQFQTLIEQANSNGQSLQAVASSLIGGDLEKLALERERRRRAVIDKLSRQINRPPAADPLLARQMDQNMLRQLAGISKR
jgi:DNA polymerase elongation subunit (family B)